MVSRLTTARGTLYTIPCESIFNTHPLTMTEWLTVLGLAILPAIAEEITKFFLRKQKA